MNLPFMFVCFRALLLGSVDAGSCTYIVQDTIKNYLKTNFNVNKPSNYAFWMMWPGNWLLLLMLLARKCLYCSKTERTVIFH